MRLLFVIDHFGSGGAQRQMMTLANSLSQRGHHISIFTYYPSLNHFTSCLDSNIRIISYNKMQRFSVSVIIALYKLLRTNPYDGILSFLSTPNVYAELMAMSGVKIPVIASVRNSYPGVKISFTRRIKEQLHKYADKVTVNTHYQRILMENRYPWIRNKVVTIYNGVDMKMFKPSLTRQNRIDMPEILGIGTIRKLKNITGIINALHLYRLRYRECPVVRWAGRIPDQGEEYREYLKANTLLEKYKLTSNWEWLGERTDIPELLRQHDVLILGSFHEGLPNALCEAFASGIPVLASNVCEHPRLIKEGENGFLFNPYDPNSITHSIKLFINTPYEERITMGRNARSFAEREFSVMKFTNSYESLFKIFILTN